MHLNQSLYVCCQQSSRHPFAGNVRDSEQRSVVRKVDDIKVVATNVTKRFGVCLHQVPGNFFSFWGWSVCWICCAAIWSASSCLFRTNSEASIPFMTYQPIMYNSHATK
jgi:hypothetical protein